METAVSAKTSDGAVAMSETERLELVRACDHRFRPIANVSTGRCFGYVAEPTGFERQGIQSVAALYDLCGRGGVLDSIQVGLWEKALETFAAEARSDMRLFLSLESRSLKGASHLVGSLKEMLARHDVPESAVVLNLMRLPTDDPDKAQCWMRFFRHGDWKIALDDFGGPASGAALLHVCEPDFVRISPYFVRSLQTDARKRLIFSQMVTLAHLVGVVVIASKVENESELFILKESGCDLVEGPLVGEPNWDPGLLPLFSRAVEDLASRDRRRRESDRAIILDQMERIEPIRVDAGVMALFERLGADTSQTFVPVVDRLEQPLGIVRESNLKNYAYSPFGKDLILNKGLGLKLRDFVVRCPVTDIHLPVEDIMSIFSGEDAAEGVILVEQARYVGFLSARSIIRVLNEKNLAAARDQNPLTRLAGNRLIERFVADSLTDGAGTYIYAYVDFDHFKPFNDKYGFRQGDRALLLFSELMRKGIGREHFLGHIGGDDFFIGFKELDIDEAKDAIAQLLERFRIDAESFYDAEARLAGGITGPDREGQMRTFPLLTASAVLIDVGTGGRGISVDDVSVMIAELKSQAKRSSGKMVVHRLGVPAKA